MAEQDVEALRKARESFVRKRRASKNRSRTQPAGPTGGFFVARTLGSVIAAYRNGWLRMGG
jgi:hypothetical protein